MLTAAHYRSCMTLKEELTKFELPNHWQIGWNESLVHRARMEMTREFLNTDWSAMMWIDADIEYDASAIAKLWNMDADIAVGAYSMKLPDKPLSAWRNGKLVKLDECPKEPFEVDYAGTGFFMVRRHVIERLIEYLEEWEERGRALVWRLTNEKLVTSDEEKTLRRMLPALASSYQGLHGRTPALYMTPIWHDGLESEDYHFCRLAREAGYKIIMDPSIKLKHWGQFAYGA